jgi:hypothetical protein
MKVKVYLMRYKLHGRSLVFSQSLDKETAFKLGRHYAKLGRSPTIVRIDADHKTLISCGTSCRKRIA